MTNKRTKLTKQSIGKWGEDVAVSYLRDNGFAIVNRNIQTPYGEIDILVEGQDVLVFVEVKTRTGDEFGNPESGITPKKKEHLINSAMYFMENLETTKTDWRIDLISIHGKPWNENPEIIWFENAVA